MNISLGLCLPSGQWLFLEIFISDKILFTKISSNYIRNFIYECEDG
jgi:hypothetical protein